MEKHDPRQVQAVEALDSWQRRVLNVEGPLVWEDVKVKGASSIRRGLLAIIHREEDKTWLYFWVLPQFQKFMLSFRKPLTRSRVDRWLTWNIVGKEHPFLKGYNTDYLRRCRRILASNPEAVMPLLTPVGGGFPNFLWSYLAKEYLNAS